MILVTLLPPTTLIREPVFIYFHKSNYASKLIMPEKGFFAKKLIFCKGAFKNCVDKTR